MQVDVFHAAGMLFLTGGAHWPSSYQHVATVFTEGHEDDIIGALEQAYRFTNTVFERHWSDNANVAASPEGRRARSTSVNDVMIAKGKVWRVRDVGFECFDTVRA